MKKLFLFLLTGLFIGTLAAQETNGEAKKDSNEEAANLKNAGNAAYKAKNYAEAFTKWEQYLKLVEYKDDACVFNTAVMANKLKKYAEAEKYFDMSIKNNYKPASSYLGKANAQEDLKKYPDMLATLEAGIKACPGQSSNLEKKYALYYMKEGQKYQKANNIAKAVENYTKITQMANPGYKAQGFLSLGTLYFNDGATILEKAAPLATSTKPSERQQYEVEKGKALDSFKKAQGYLVQGSSADSQNADIKEALKQVNEAIATHSKK